MQDPPTDQPLDPPRSQAGAQRRARRTVIGLGLTALILAAAWVSTRPLGGDPIPIPAQSASFDARGGSAVGVGIGQSAPDFLSADDGRPLLKNLDGNPVRLGDFAGKPVWIVFWATWCVPCQQEAGDILALYHAHQADGLVVLAIDVQEPAAAVREFALSHDLDYPIGLDPTAAVRALYGGWALPTHFFLDGNGVIRDRYLGQMTADVMAQRLKAIIGS